MAEVKPLVLEDGRTRVMRSTDVVHGQAAADAEVLRQSKIYTDRRVGESGTGSGGLDKKFRLRILHGYDF